MDIAIRPYRPDDLETLRQLTTSAFVGVSLEQNVEATLGILNGHDWQWRKARHVDEDVRANAAGIFVAERTIEVVGYISTVIDRESGKGRIPNLVVAESLRGQGLGRRLIEHALDYFRREGLAYAMIETMAQNEIGDHLYRACGFVEVARQIHFARQL
ncbi:GNAT family N-acetyltransferase [Anatilimnocola sp. NA78]|uniref:GNAT family N-acetyltransferase n=1 Tax=Anatilimnocola sp. NA78 TaxID=3415683 RepID=UPI003CE5B0B4